MAKSGLWIEVASHALCKVVLVQAVEEASTVQYSSARTVRCVDTPDFRAFRNRFLPENDWMSEATRHYQHRR